MEQGRRHRHVAAEKRFDGDELAGTGVKHLTVKAEDLLLLLPDEEERGSRMEER